MLEVVSSPGMSCIWEQTMPLTCLCTHISGNKELAMQKQGSELARWHMFTAIASMNLTSVMCFLDPQVMYDASGVRLHAGRQASVLNMIITELPPDHPVSDTRPLRDTLGHTPLQVAVGAMLGMVTGYIVGVSWHTSS